MIAPGAALHEMVRRPPKDPLLETAGGRIACALARPLALGVKRKGTPSGVPQDRTPTSVILSDGAKRRVEGPPYFVFAVAFAFVITASTSKAQAVQHPDLQQLKDVKTRTCDQEEIALFTSNEALSLLSVYGYSKDTAWMCESISASWLPSAKIVQLHGFTAAVDSNMTVTFVRVKTGERLWLIPAINGMVTHAGIWDDPHNRAVLNDLLRISKYKPKSPNEWTELGLLYLYMTGWEIHLEDYSKYGEKRRGLKSFEPQLNKLELAPSIAPDKHGIEITVNEVTADENYNVWDFYFAWANDAVLLTSATREQHKISEQEN